jgi:hypothetical protein
MGELLHATVEPPATLIAEVTAGTERLYTPGHIPHNWPHRTSYNPQTPITQVCSPFIQFSVVFIPHILGLHGSALLYILPTPHVIFCD